jgi:hypothetical protein
VTVCSGTGCIVFVFGKLNAAAAHDHRFQTLLASAPFSYWSKNCKITGQEYRLRNDQTGKMDLKGK